MRSVVVLLVLISSFAACASSAPLRVTSPARPLAGPRPVVMIAKADFPRPSTPSRREHEPESAWDEEESTDLNTPDAIPHRVAADAFAGARPTPSFTRTSPLSAEYEPRPRPLRC
jgi:hypothetical protein